MSGRFQAVIVEADGGSRGNPGNAAYGAVLRDAGTGAVIAEEGTTIGVATNNVAEYSGLIAGLRMAAELAPDADIEVRMDSKLVVEQMSGRWKIKDRRLAGIAAQATRAFDPALVRYTWVPRAQNGHADRLANEAMDGTERRVEDVVAALAADPDVSSPDDPTDPVGAVDPAPDPLPSRAAGAAPSATAVPAGASQGDLGQATTVLLVRHGRTRLTQERRFSGVRGEDAPLTDVGRLDADTEGLLLLTNDGELAHRLSHPSYEVPKTYLAEVLGPVARDVGKRLREGVELDDGIVRVDSFKLVDSTSNRVLLELVLHEGRKHVVRRALAEVGHPVQQLVRTAVGGVQLGGQKPGKIRNLTREELAGLFAAVKM